MDVTSGVLFGFVGLLAMNYIVPRLEAVRRMPAVFWLVNGLNGVAALVLLLFGIPGFDTHPAVRYLMGLLLLMHLAQNFAIRSRWEAEDRQDRLEEEYRTRSDGD